MRYDDFRVARKAWYKPPKNDLTVADEATLAQERWLSEWRDEPAYVLLGDPGLGKTESLKAEVKAVGGVSIPISRIQEGLAQPLGADALVFIDALDEVKGSTGGNIVGAIARYLRDNGKPRFRIACREADWRVKADRELLEAVAPGGMVRELHLCPLNDEDIQDILKCRSTDVPDAQAFVEQAKIQGVQDWLRNPLLLNLMVESVAQNGQLPGSRLEIYQAACHAMAHEHNDRHREHQALSAGVVQNVLEDSGSLCALLLLSGKIAISKSAKPAAQVMALPALPKDLNLHDTEQAVKSKLFSTEDDFIRPRHRTIAEFLGAQALAKRIRDGLPLARVLALVQGHDGVPVESMRGLCAWLAVHLDGDQRRLVLEADPLGFVVNGDAGALTHDERLQLIHGLAERSKQNPWFRNEQWESHPFGPLAAPDMQNIFAYELARPDRSESHQMFVDCLLDALQHAPKAMPGLVPVLTQWVMDAQVKEFVRVSAYRAWHRHAPPEEQGEQIKAWLQALEGQRHTLNSLVETLLSDAYPKWIQADVLRFLPDDEGHSMWWSYKFMRLTPPDLLPTLARAWLEKFPDGLPIGHNFDRTAAAVALLDAVLEQHGERAAHQDLYEWLAIGLNKYGSVDQNEKSEGIVRWLQARPQKIKAVAKLCWENLEVNQQGNKFFSSALQRLRRVSLPGDWVRWQMSVALDVAQVHVAHYLLQAVNHSVESKSLGFDLPTAQELATWVQVLSVKHSEAAQWFEEAQAQVSHNVDKTNQWEKQNAQRRVRRDTEREHERQKRQKEIKPHLDQRPDKPLPAELLSNIAYAYEKRFTNIQGETPELRVAELLGSVLPQDLEKALKALDACLMRDDVPTVEEIIDTAAQHKWFYLQMPFLLAARRASERDSQAWRTWPVSTQQKVFAFWLTYAAEETPLWLVPLGSEFPAVIAPVLVAFAKSKFKQKSFQSLSGLWQISKEPSWQAMAERVLPELLESFPLSVGEDGNRLLNRDLLAALYKVPASQAKALVEKKLEIKSLDAGQRIAWLLAWMRYEPERAVAELVESVDEVQTQYRRVAMLYRASTEQAVFTQGLETLPAASIQRMIEWMAPLTPRTVRPKGVVFAETDEMQREDMVRAFIKNLANNPSPEAATALLNLVNNPRLNTWEKDFSFHLQQQRHLQREATFQPASVQAVAKLLCNQGPANVGDLLALVVDHLKGLKKELRGDTSFQLRHFWHGDTGTAKAKKTQNDRVPSIENDCTLELLALLRPRLQALGVALDVESQAANQKRIDLRASCTVDGQRVTLPIEAKKDDHIKVWTAWREQLQKLYTIDPGAQGHGIYLVYWFGQSPKSAPPLDGNQPSVKPQSATEMRTMLQARIPSKDQHLMKVVVLDLSWPD